ncbi:hypothetical protein H696_01722 [Fonticula alba]|uniref:Sorting nexin-3 n=1 Tax=Fonticula alba TaxID=691883 RepID=A0A058ZFS8_FONAL|nr:hypothetical protein H696_01722 [Fonticula alba]KCV72327.1 hypothetical protein H696_01722 [Fonticula alba]|eukprot:XP_009493905.1 hypothetical protein H696_01722 [Fonticula alba]
MSTSPSQPSNSRAWAESSRLPYAAMSADDSSYAMPENFLEIEVTRPLVVPDSAGKANHVTYEIIVRTNIPTFPKKQSSVRRRYSDFVQFRSDLLKQQPRVPLPSLPPKRFLNNLSEEVISERQEALQRFLDIVAGHPILQTGSRLLGDFLQSPNYER